MQDAGKGKRAGILGTERGGEEFPSRNPTGRMIRVFSVIDIDI